jgi:hypothetical protein
MDMPYALILDVLLAVLLLVTIVYAVILNNRLTTLRRDKKDLQKLTRTFGEITVRAEEGTAQLRATTEVLQDKITKAETLREDLVFLVKRGNDTADALEVLVRSSRDDTAVAPRAAKASPSTDTREVIGKKPPVEQKPDAPLQRRAPRVNQTERPDSDEISDAELELLKALRSAS